MNKHDETRNELRRLERAARELTMPPRSIPRPVVKQHGPRQAADVQMCRAISDWLCVWYKEHIA